MTQIDEKALYAAEAAIYDYCYEAGFSATTIATRAIKAYESARTPRRITREELAKATKAICDADEKSNGEAPFSELAKAALATLGIAVEG